ncbi:MAG: CHAT domain-containing protein [Vicinamibacterales bacterium]
MRNRTVTCRGRTLAVLLALATWLAFTPSVAASRGQASSTAAEVEEAIEEVDRLLGRSAIADAAARLERLRATPGMSIRQEAEVLTRLAAAQVHLGRSQQAMRTADAAATRAGEAEAIDLLARLELTRGTAWRVRGFPYRSLEHYDAAFDLAGRAQDDSVRSLALAQLADVYQELGEWDRVLDYAERAYRMRSSPSENARFAYLVQRGIAYFEFNDRRRAADAFESALEIARATGNARNQSVALGELGLVALEFDRDLERALALFDEAIALARGEGLTGLLVSWLNNTGGALRDSGRLAEALEVYQEAVRLEERAGQRRDRPYLLKNIGQVLSMSGRPREAEGYLLEAVALADRQNVPKIRWMARLELGDVHRDDDPELADRYFSEALSILEASLASVLMEHFRVGELGRALSRYDAFDRYIDFLLQHGRDADAFAVAERARARVFLETLASARGSLAADVPEAYRDAEGELLARISTLQGRLRAEDLTGRQRRETVAAIEHAEEELASLRVRLSIERPTLADVRFPRIWPVDEVRTSVLAPDETLALFFLGRTRSALWLLDRAGLRTVALPPRDAIESAVERVLATVRTPGAAIDQEAAGWLSTALAAPMMEAARGDRLTIVPHGLLHYLPFEMLTGADGRHLVERYVIAYAPSVSSLAHLRQRSQAPRTPHVLAVGSPTIVDGGPDGPERSGLPWVGRFEPLPHAGVEVRHIAATFAPGSRVLEAGQATEDALRSADLARVDILHFATHALIDEESPDRSGLLLTRGSSVSDGILQAREVYRLRLNARLVTLSACQTALGRQVSGEGMVGLSRAFFYAGAGAVAASLWNVSDRATADLMTVFYRAVRDGLPVDAALTEAKRQFLRAGGARSHPYFWAPFIVTGHARVTIASAGLAAGPSGWPAPVWAALATGAVLLLVVCVARARGRQRPGSARTNAIGGV